MSRARIRDLGINIGYLPTGTQNAITDVPGVWVGHHTLIYDQPDISRTGVTVILPRSDKSREDHAFAGFYSLNGNGEMTGLLWLEESGLLGSPIGLTNTNQVGVVRDALTEYSVIQHSGRGFRLPVVAETWDGWLNHMDAFHLTKEHVFAALQNAGPGPVPEGNVGGGTGMICHDFKGGIGTASRIVQSKFGAYTLGVLVQSNYGDRRDLRVNGLPVGLELSPDVVPLPWDTPQSGGSIIIIIATDAPLIPSQCKRLARRAAIGLGRVGGIGNNGSGDIFLAFATGNHIDSEIERLYQLQMIPNHLLDLFFEAVIEAVEESIINALCAAETMQGYKGHTVYELPLEDLKKILQRYSGYGQNQ